MTDKNEFPLPAPPQSHFLDFVPEGRHRQDCTASSHTSWQAFSCKEEIPFKAAQSTTQHLCKITKQVLPSPRCHRTVLPIISGILLAAVTLVF